MPCHSLDSLHLTLLSNYVVQKKDRRRRQGRRLENISRETEERKKKKLVREDKSFAIVWHIFCNKNSIFLLDESPNSSQTG